MAEIIKLGSNGNWGVKPNGVLAYNDENNVFKAIELASSRASGATYVSESGLIADAESGVPRIDWTNGVGELLLEPQSTNLITYSEEFSNAAWSKLTNTTVTDNKAISPSGAISASEFKATSTSTSLIAVQDSISVSSSTDYTISFFAKKGVVRYVQLFHGTGQVLNNPRTNFDLEDGVVSVSDADHNSYMQDYGNGWYRCIAEVNTNSTTLQAYITAVNTANASRGATSNWTANDNFYVWGAQVEQLSYPTSYIRTEGSQVTRIQDAVTGNSSLGQVINSSELVLYIDFERFGFDSSIDTTAVVLKNGGSQNIRFHFDYPSQQIRFRDALNGFANIGNALTVSSNTRVKVALIVNGTTAKFFANGSQQGSDYTIPTPFSIDTLSLSASAMRIRELKVYDTALTDSQLQTLTTI